MNIEEFENADKVLRLLWKNAFQLEKDIECPNCKSTNTKSISQRVLRQGFLTIMVVVLILSFIVALATPLYKLGFVAIVTSLFIIAYNSILYVFFKKTKFARCYDCNNRWKF